MKKITTILMLLMLSIGAWAEDGSITVTSGNAVWTGNEGTYDSATPKKIWRSNATGKPVVTITGASEKNGTAWNNANGVLMCQKGTDGLLTLTISIAGDYRITGFTFTGQNAAWTNNVAVKFSSNGQEVQGTSNVQMTVTGLNTVSTTITAITLETGERGKITDFVIYYTKLEDYTDNVNTNIKPWIESIDGGYFKLTSSNPDVANLLQEYNAHNTGDTWTQGEYENLVSLLDAAKASEGAYLMPETGYYRIKNTNRGRNSYLAYGLPSKNQNRGSGLVTIDESGAPTDASTIFKLTKTAYNNYTFGTEGMVVYAPAQNNWPFRTSGSEGDAVTYKFTVMSSGVVAIGPANVTDPNAQRYFHEGDDANWGEIHAVVQWTATAAPSQWTVEEANELGQGAYALEIALTTIDSKSYATTRLPFPVTLSDDAEAYTVKIDGKKAVETLLGNEIPAEAPVLLISETAAEKVYATVAEVTTTVSGNDLKGVFVKTAKAELQGETPVVLNQKNGKVGFYKLADGSSLSANRAYLSYVEGTTPQPAKAFFEEGFELGGNEATAIENIENGAFDNGAVYNLQGQRIGKAQKGVFIQNGKKVVLK